MEQLPDVADGLAIGRVVQEVEKGLADRVTLDPGRWGRIQGEADIPGRAVVPGPATTRGLIRECATCTPTRKRRW